MVDTGLLAETLKWLMSAGAGVVTFFVLEKIPELKALSSEAKRYISIALASLLSMGAYAAGVGLGYEPMPVSAQAWAEALFAVAFVASGLSQVIHGKAVLSKRK